MVPFYLSARRYRSTHRRLRDSLAGFYAGLETQDRIERAVFKSRPPGFSRLDRPVINRPGRNTGQLKSGSISLLAAAF